MVGSIFFVIYEREPLCMFMHLLFQTVLYLDLEDVEDKVGIMVNGPLTLESSDVK